MTLKEIKKHYRVRKMDGYYDLSTIDVQTSGRSVYKYLCTIYKINGYKFHLKGCEPTGKFDVLQTQINDYLGSLKYDSEYYCPSYVKGAGQDLLIYDLLREYGFSRLNYSDTFTYDVKSIYDYNTTDIKITYDIDVECESVTISLHTGSWSWISVKSDFNFDNIHATLDGLLKPLLLTEGINNIKTSDKMSNSNIEMVANSIKGLETITSKVELKAKLLELANTL